MALTDLFRTSYVTLDTSLPPGTLTFRAMSGQERLGQPFSYRLEVTSGSVPLSGADLIGKPVAVHIELGTGELRHVHALVTAVQNGGTHKGNHRYYLTLRPWLWLLSHVRTCRIFQGQTIPDIVKAVFREHSLTDFEDHLFEIYQPREMVVQYCESDFNFVSRLLEAEGIYYYFKHESAKHLLVLADDQSSHARDPNCESLPYYVPDEHEQGFQEGVDQWAPVEHFRPDQVATKNYDFKQVGADLNAERQQPTYPDLSGFEVFEYPGPHSVKANGEGFARVRLEELHSTLRVIDAQTNAPGLLMGRLFELTDHPQEAENAEYLVTSTNITVRAPDLESGGDGGSNYLCQFEAMLGSTPFRPPRVAPKPYLRGPQTAVVVTYGDEDIWTDVHGRIRVKFDWDRFGATDETASAWIRVAQLWAGAGWGAQFIPRVGMEVVVLFLEGDPERPLVTGCVYNSLNTPPYAPDTSFTQSGIKTRSTKKGSEELHIQAEKDMTTLVKHDQSTTVQANRSAGVTGNDSVSVGGDRSVSVTGNLSVTVEGAGKGPTHSEYKVTGKHSLDVSDTIAISAKTSITLTVGTSTITITPSMIELFSKGSTVTIDPNIFAHSNGKATLMLDANACITGSGEGSVLCDANVLAASAKGTSSLLLDGKATLAANADVILDGAKVTGTGKSEASLTGGGSSSVKLSPASADLAGGMANVSGTSMVSISGGMVKVN